MSWLYSRALVEAYLPDETLGGAPCALWSATHTQPPSWLPDKTTDACRLSLSGMMYAPLTGDRGEAVLTSYRADFPVRTSALRERAPELPGSDPGCGAKWQELSVRYDPDSCSWKTHHCLWEEVLRSCSVTLPNWGMMRNGVLWERVTSALPTGEIVSGLWPTPKAGSAGMSAKTSGRDVSKSTHLTTQVALAEGIVSAETGRVAWPTPKSVPSGPDYARANRAASGGDDLATAIARETFATPKGRDWKGQSQRGIHAQGDALPNKDRGDGVCIGGQLNPDWVELLMGWPKGWTDVDSVCGGAIVGWGDGWERDTPRITRRTAHRAARLKCIGNGQVPAAAVEAWRILRGCKTEPERV